MTSMGPETGLCDLIAECCTMWAELVAEVIMGTVDTEASYETVCLFPTY